jgi:hypothetical protein
VVVEAFPVKASGGVAAVWVESSREREEGGWGWCSVLGDVYG